VIAHEACGGVARDEHHTRTDTHPAPAEAPHTRRDSGGKRMPSQGALVVNQGHRVRVPRSCGLDAIRQLAAVPPALGAIPIRAIRRDRSRWT